MNLKNSKGSVLLMVTVFGMIFLVLAIATMKILLQTDQDQSAESEIARIQLFYAADGISEIAMYAAAKNLMYDPRGHNTNGTIGANGTSRILTSYQMEGDIWPNLWSTASGVHFDFSDPILNAVTADVLEDKRTTNEKNNKMMHYKLNADNASALAVANSDIKLMPANLLGRQVLGTGGEYAYDVDFNVPYRSNINPMASLTDNVRYRQPSGINRQIWYMHLTPENPNYDEDFDYTGNGYWCTYYPEMSVDNNIQVKATMYQEFVLSPEFDGGTRKDADPDFIKRGDGWPNIDVSGATRGWPSEVRRITVENGAEPDSSRVPMQETWFYGDDPSGPNHYNGGNARRRYFAIIAEARFSDRNAGGVFGETYKIETRFFIEDDRTYAQYESYKLGSTALVDKPRVKFYFRSRIPRPI